MGGTVQFPKNFLKKAFETVKSHGGVCISDEVSAITLVVVCQPVSGFPYYPTF